MAFPSRDLHSGSLVSLVFYLSHVKQTVGTCWHQQTAAYQLHQLPSSHILCTRSPPCPPGGESRGLDHKERQRCLANATETETRDSREQRPRRLRATWGPNFSRRLEETRERVVDWLLNGMVHTVNIWLWWYWHVLTARVEIAASVSECLTGRLSYCIRFTLKFVHRIHI